MCDLQTTQYFYCNMKRNGLGPHCSSALSPGTGGVAGLAWWHALVQTERKQLLPLPRRTLSNSLSCSKELCCLILLFLNMLSVACWHCFLLPRCLLLGHVTSPCLGKVLYKLHRGHLTVWGHRPVQEDLTALATGTSLAWEVGVGGCMVVVSSCRAQ